MTMLQETFLNYILINMFVALFYKWNIVTVSRLWLHSFNYSTVHFANKATLIQILKDISCHLHYYSRISLYVSYFRVLQLSPGSHAMSVRYRKLFHPGHDPLGYWALTVTYYAFLTDITPNQSMLLNNTITVWELSKSVT